ncbi:MAG: thiamine-phosphate kinase [Kiloniellales bacterium]
MLGEFERIARFFAPLAGDWPGALGLIDDAALVDLAAGRTLVVTADALVAGVHYPADEAADLVAARLVRVNLSDLAAMGARPLAYLITLALPAEIDDEWLQRFAGGLKREQAAYHITLIGGDSVATPGPTCLSLTALGSVPEGRALRRDGAQAGDLVLVSGSIGDAALGLIALKGDLDGVGAKHRAQLVDRYRLPRPRVALGERLVGLAHAALDVSDGLVADLAHICTASGVGAVIEADRLPLSPAARAALPAVGLAPVLGGGDDYELLFTIAPGNGGRVAELARSLDLALTEIGRIRAGTGVTVVDRDGREIPVPRPGYRHR